MVLVEGYRQAPHGSDGLIRRSNDTEGGVHMGLKRPCLYTRLL